MPRRRSSSSPLSASFLPLAIALSAAGVIGVLSVSPLGEVFRLVRSRAAHAEVAVVAHDRTEIRISAAKGENATHLRFAVPALGDSVTLYTPPAWQLQEVRGRPIAAIAQATHEDFTSYVIPPCGKLEDQNSKSETANAPFCEAAELRFLAPRTDALTFSTIGPTPLLLDLTTLDLSTRAFAQVTRIVHGTTVLPLTP